MYHLLMPDPLTQLSTAIRTSDLPSIQKLLSANPRLDLNAPLPDTPFGSTALLEAVSHHNLALIDLLLDAGADPNARSHWWAGSFGVLDTCAPDLAPHLISRGAKLTAHSAARLNMPGVLKQLISSDPSLIHSRGGDGQTPLHFAATPEIADLLIDAGADINARDIDHESTSAMWMIRDRTEVARHLVNQGCETDLLLAAALGDVALVQKHLAESPHSIHLTVRDEHFPRKNLRAASTIYLWTLGFGQTPHSVARAFGHQSVAQYLLEHSPSETRFVAACQIGDEAAVKRLLAQNPDAVKNLTAEDAWHLAAAGRNNDTQAVRLMLSCGFPVNALGPHGGTPLHWSAWHGNLAAVQLILAHHADLTNTQNDFHATPMNWALHGSQNSWHRKTGNYPAVVRALLDAGAPAPEVPANSNLDVEILKVVGGRDEVTE
jgi:ankyrin repeat protein